MCFRALLPVRRLKFVVSANPRFPLLSFSRFLSLSLSLPPSLSLSLSLSGSDNGRVLVAHSALNASPSVSEREEIRRLLRDGSKQF